MFSIHNILGLLILLADIFAIFKIVNSRETTGMKALWIIIILIFPFLGLLIWFFAGPGDKSLKL